MRYGQSSREIRAELWDVLEDGTIITLKLKSRGGVEGAPDQVNTANLIFKISG